VLPKFDERVAEVDTVVGAAGEGPPVEDEGGWSRNISQLSKLKGDDMVRRSNDKGATARGGVRSDVAE